MIFSNVCSCTCLVVSCFLSLQCFSLPPALFVVAVFAVLLEMRQKIRYILQLFPFTFRQHIWCFIILVKAGRPSEELLSLPALGISGVMILIFNVVEGFCCVLLTLCIFFATQHALCAKLEDERTRLWAELSDLAAKFWKHLNIEESATLRFVGQATWDQGKPNSK
jgi:hypothetical protein